ncbi:hypothetical protein RCF27_08260 [Rhodococcus pyridinivorans]|uniref:hypothetical protein n=1 Tax=Rhodococcus pyridinivorans TaxID=103816 RepID=UPI00280BCAE2|nr:hypothetical protein [Rhodococcus pyridinivorans]WMM74271.1 hypothetical protein RCF27_08260 [Rhodococcus pyridinivorans]
MSEAKFSSGLPKGETVNGLTAMTGQMSERPEALHVAVIVFDTSKITIDTDTGDATPTARIRRIEPITIADDKKQLNKLVTRAFEQRTGKTVLPLDLEDEIRSAFGDDSSE